MKYYQMGMAGDLNEAAACFKTAAEQANGLTSVCVGATASLVTLNLKGEIVYTWGAMGLGLIPRLAAWFLEC